MQVDQSVLGLANPLQLVTLYPCLGGLFVPRMRIQTQHKTYKLIVAPVLVRVLLTGVIPGLFTPTSFLLPLTGPPAHGAHHHVLVPGPLHAVGAAAAWWGPGTAGTCRPGSGGELASMS